jgi:hypothetical protein
LFSWHILHRKVLANKNYKKQGYALTENSSDKCFIFNKEKRKHKFGWIGHILRNDDSEPCKAALQWNPQGTRGRGRPRNSWR